ncbi:hypothetical protein ACLB2K_066646 [Fragaria x ananassa]
MTLMPASMDMTVTAGFGEEEGEGVLGVRRREGFKERERAVWIGRVTVVSFGKFSPPVKWSARYVSRLTAVLAISEKGKVSFGASGATAYSGHAYAVGRLLSSKKKVPKSFMATMAAMWGKKNRVQIAQEGDQYVLRFSEKEERDQIVEIFSFPLDLKTKEALFMVGATLGTIIQHDLPNLKTGAMARIWIEHPLDSLVKQAYPLMVFEFGEGNVLTSAWLTFKYERMCRFCRICGLLEHLLSGCHGSLDMSAAVRIGAPSGNLNSSNSAYPSGSTLNPFQNIKSHPVQTRLAPVQPLFFRQVVESPPVLVSLEIVLSTKTISGTKRNASSLMEVDLGKSPMGPPIVLETVEVDLGHALELSLPNFTGTLIVSPPKKNAKLDVWRVPKTDQRRRISLYGSSRFSGCKKLED